MQDDREYTTKRTQRAQLQYRSSARRSEPAASTQVKDEPIIDLREGETKWTERVDAFRALNVGKIQTWLKNVPSDLKGLNKSIRPRSRRLLLALRQFYAWFRTQPVTAQAVSGLLVFSLLFTAGLIASYDKPQDVNDVLSETAAQEVTTKADVPFKAVEPADSSAVGERLYDSSRSIYNFQESINGVTLTVTQQQLPDNLKSGELSLQTLALSLPNKASFDQLTDSSGTAFYVANNNNGSQTALYASEEVLVFITAQQRLEQSVWIAYIDSLE